MELNFRLRYSKNTPSLGTLYARITVDGHRAPEKSLHIKVKKSEWNSKLQEIDHSSELALTTNALIIKIKDQANSALLYYKGRDEEISARKISEYIFGTKRTHKRLSDIYNDFEAMRRATANNSEETYIVYRRYLSRISDYFKLISHSNPFIYDITESNYLGLCAHLKVKYKRDYAAKISQFCRTLLIFAQSRGHITGNPSLLVTLSKEDSYDTTCLSLEQVKALAKLDIDSIALPPRTLELLHRERDSFVFCCFTGQHHIDYISKDYKLFERNGATWLSGFRVKSKEGARDKLYEFPLHPLAKMIIDKYGGIENLPVRKNAKRNQILKLLAAHAGIEINLCTKTARKTMANYLINDLLVRWETVAAVLGMKTTKYLKHYAKVKRESIEREVIHDVKPSLKKPVQFASDPLKQIHNQSHTQQNYVSNA